MNCVRYIVRGRVQGVGFRAFVLWQGRALSLRGFVRNLSDGSVECMACGEGATLKTFASRLREGPPHARVDDLVEQTAPPEAFGEFEIR